MTTQIHTAAIVAALALLGGLTAAQAQPRPCRGGAWAEGAAYQQAFDPRTVQTIEGTIAAVEQIASRGMSPGIHLRLKTSTETIEVHLGPAWFVESDDFSLAAGNKVQIRGSRVKYQGKTYDTGSKIGFLMANVAYALEREELSGEFRKELEALLRQK